MKRYFGWEHQRLKMINKHLLRSWYTRFLLVLTAVLQMLMKCLTSVTIVRQRQVRAFSWILYTVIIISCKSTNYFELSVTKMLESLSTES